MKRRRLIAAAGLAAVFLAGVLVGHFILTDSPPAPPAAFASAGPSPAVPYDTSERAGLSPGDPAGYEQPSITPLNAPSPARLIAPPPHGHDAQALSPRGSGVASDPDIPAPSITPFPFLLLIQSHHAGAEVTPLNVRDPSALVMAPGAVREPDERIPDPATPAQVPAPVPASVQKAFGR